ncbi:MAG: hypothetical protein IPP49_02275 [Saprospiraceae bacterium]|nr:hypothetical protein [Saprospiraceae bacterium]
MFSSGRLFAQPANDLCSNATVISGTLPITLSTQTNVGATTTGEPTATCGTTPGTPGVWYTFPLHQMDNTL